MKQVRSFWSTAVVLAAAVLLPGCGGSGSSSGGAGGGDGTQLFAVDDLNTAYDHVWVTIDSISLTSAGGGSTTIFDATSQGGKVVDLRSLHDASGAKFLLLGGFNTPAGSYTGINVTVATGLTIIPAGAATGTAATFASASGPTYILSLAFPSAETISASNKVVVDFDLANWSLAGNIVSAPTNAFLALGSTAGIEDGNRHVPSDYDGSVSALAGTSPSETFTLTQGRSTLTVATSSATTIVNSDGSANPSLANAQKVDVTGTFDATNNVLNATSITIRLAAATVPPQLIRGLVTAFDATAQTLTVQAQGCDRFQPGATSLTLSVGTGTIYFGSSGVTDTEAQFFAALVAGKTQIVADGTLSGLTFTAIHAGIVGPPIAPTTFDTALRGPVSNPNAAAGTFDVTVNDWEGGRRPSKSATVHVVTTASTVFETEGAAGTQAGFFTSLSASTLAQVRGSLDPTTQTLTAVLVATGDGGGFHF
jgi:hypothetical protein